jgi:DNA repair exonuclease SbcCD nuclease subunit
MNNILLFSDLHITQSSSKECISILEEIGMLTNKYNVDTLIDLGDTFDSLKPNSTELDIFATFIRKLNKKIIILAANSHESTTQEESILNHYGILSDNVTVVKEFKDGIHLYCGHYSLKESTKNYDAKLSKEIFKDYLYVFLGHIHSYELIKPNVVHLGSSRYVSFDEVKDKQKIVSLITDYGTEGEKVHFLKLKSPIPMIQIELNSNNNNKLQENNLKINPKEAQGGTTLDQTRDIGKDTLEPKSGKIACTNPPNTNKFEDICQLSSFLDKTDPKTKVKIKIMDFESFRQFLPLCNKYSTKFETFKYETDFEVVSSNDKKCIQAEMTSFKESFINWLKNQKIDPKITEILQKEVE